MSLATLIVVDVVLAAIAGCMAIACHLIALTILESVNES